MSLSPQEGVVVLKLKEVEQTTSSGIVLSSSTEVNRTIGQVIAVGDFTTIKKDDIVVFDPKDITQFAHNGDTLFAVKEENVLVTIG